MARLLVTGAGGLLGGALVAALTADGHAVTATGRREPPGGGIAADLAEPAEVARLMAAGPFDVVLHAAARLDTTAPASAHVRDNLLATLVLAEAARAAGVPRLLFYSTISVHDGEGPFAETTPADATDPYGVTKAAAETLLAGMAGSTFTVGILRLAGLHGVGRRSGVVYRFLERALAGQPVDAAEPDSLFTLSFVDDVIAATRLALVADFAGHAARTYNIAAAEAVSLAELARLCAGPDGTVNARSGAPSRNRILRSERARTELGFAPADVATHVAALRRWIEAGS